MQTLNIFEILAELEIVEGDFCRVLSISEDHDLELYLKGSQSLDLLVTILMMNQSTSFQ